MKAIRAWAAISGALLLAALCLRTLPTSWQGVAILGGVMLTNLGLLVYILRR